MVASCVNTVVGSNFKVSKFITISHVIQDDKKRVTT